MGRTQEIKSERRRRSSDDIKGFRTRLTVNESALDRKNYEYRFANDENDRIHHLTVDDDWELVENDGIKSNSSGVGNQVAVHAGTSERGAPVKAILLRKPKSYADDDAAEKRAKIDETVRGLKAGQAPGASSEGLRVPAQGGGIRMSD